MDIYSYQNQAPKGYQLYTGYEAEAISKLVDTKIEDFKKQYPSIKSVQYFVEISDSPNDVKFRVNMSIIVDEYEYIADVLIHNKIDIKHLIRSIWFNGMYHPLTFKIQILEVNDIDFRY